MKILVRGTNWIGDAVMSVPALKALRRSFPDAQITLHTRSWAEDIFLGVDFIDEIVPYNPSRLKIRDVYDNAAFLRDDGYDLAIIFPNSFESALVSLLSKIPRRIGYNKDVRGLLLTDPIAVPEWKNREHEVFYYLNLIQEVERRVLGKQVTHNEMPDISINIDAGQLAKGREKLRSAGVTGLKKVIALGPGSTNSLAKRWRIERFAKLADELASTFEATILLLGSAAESLVAAKLISLARTSPIDLTGKTDLGEAAAILQIADLFVSNDMGLAHLAAAVGTPTIVLFGPTDPMTTRPYSRKAVIITKNVECAPCMLRDCPIDHRCMTGILVTDVMEKASEILIEGFD